MNFRFSLAQDFFLALRLGIIPTGRSILSQPTLLFRPRELSRLFFSHVWIGFGPLVDEGGREVKERLIRGPHGAWGAVLDIGAGHGHSVNYLDRSRVTKYIALEPNEEMHSHIVMAASKAGFHASTGELIILGCGAENINRIRSELRDTEVNTILSILTLCTIPNAETAIRSLAQEVLHPDGQWLFYEHVQSDLPHVGWWQSFWTPLWRIAFDGCELDRPTHLWIENAGGWISQEVWGKEGEDEENLFWHRAGRFVKGPASLPPSD